MATVPSPRRRERIIARDSVLRASILDTALELGVGDSSAVARWMFSPVQEVDEDLESMVSPSLTYASTATSEESAFFASHFRHHRPGAGASASNSISSQTHSLAKSDAPTSDGLAYSRIDGLTPDADAQRVIHFDVSATPEPRAPSPMPTSNTPSKSGKLRKARPDGYESDGGYISDGTKGKKEKDKKKMKKKVKEDGNIPEEESDGGYLSEISFRRKKKDKKSKADKTSIDKTVTDGESDGGYISMSFGRSKKERAVAKAVAAATTPATGDESDGAYLSESSLKKKSRFFRLHGKSSRKKNSTPDAAPEVPPVPSLPPMQLRIADMFSRSMTPLTTDESRADTPAPSEHTVIESTHSTSVSSMDPFEAVPIPLPSPKPITNAFKDAESVRSPSTDLLSTFGRRQLPSAHSPIRAKAPSIDTISTTASSAESPIASKPTSPLRSPPVVPMISVPKPRRNSSTRTTPPLISAPNTQALAGKHTPVPLVLTPPTPAANAGSFGKSSPALPTSQSSDSLSPWSRTSDVPRSPSPSQSTVPSPQPSPMGANGVRPHVLAYYDLPPPSPPPSGPLPRIPPLPEPRTPRHDWSQQRAPSPVWKTDLSPGGSSSVPSSARSPNSPLFLQRVPSSFNQQRGRESPFPVSTASTSGEEPLARITSNQRGRESPFPTHPVLPREESAELVRRTSIARHNSPTRSTRPLRIGAKVVNISGPVSADVSRDPQTLDAHWQPRSASVLETRQSEESRRSWIDYDDATLDYHRTSSDEQADSQEGSASVYHDDERKLSGEHTRLPAPEPEERSTQYYDAEESDGEADAHRYSVWSAKSRISILDKERSGSVRQKFVQRVEAMYGKSSIPPVPKLPPAKPGMF